MQSDEIVLVEQYLREGDYVTLQHRNYLLCSQGFKQQSLCLRNSKKNIIESIFVLETAKNQDKMSQTGTFIMFGQKIYLRHLLTKKYLSYSIHSNRDDIYLKSTKSTNCIFILKPLLKFQSEYGRKIRIGDQIQIQSPQKLSLYIEIGARDQSWAECMLSLSKYQKSEIFVSRFSNLAKQKGQLTSISIYQLLLVENDMKLFASIASQNQAKIGFVDYINPYGSFLVFQGLMNEGIRQEQIINYNQPVIIRFFTHALYFGFDSHFKPKLFNNPCEECIFSLESYEGSNLKELAVLKLKHKSSGLYVGWEREELVLQQSKLKNLFYVKRVDFEKLKVAIIINNIYTQLFNIFQQKNMLQFKNRLQGLLEQLIRVIYGSSFNHEQFLKMNMKMELKIQSSEQNLLVEIGFLELILDKAVTYLETITKSGSEVKKFYQQAIVNMMIVVAGICHKNQKNGQLLIKYFVYFFKAIFNVPNMIEVITYLFSESIISRIQTNELIISNKKVRLVNIILDQIEKKRFWSPNEQLNIFKLIQKLLISKDNQKYLIHEYQIMKAFNSSRLSKLFYQTKIIDDEITVQIEGQQIELSDIYQKKAKYRQSITLINAQLGFLCSLFTHTSSKNLQSFQRIIPQQVALNYIKSKMQTDYKKIFLKVMDQVYLCRFNPKSSKLLHLNGESIKNMSFIDRDTLTNLKSIVFQGLNHIFGNDLEDRYLYMYVKIICHLSKFGQISGKQWEILSKLESYLCRKYQFIKNAEQFEELSAVVLQLYVQHQSFKIQQASSQIVKKIHQQISKKKQKLEQGTIQGIIQTILEEYHTYSICALNYQYIQQLIATSIQQNLNILQRASQVMNLINKSQYGIVQRLKQLVLIGPQEEQLLKQLNQLHLDLNSLFDQYSKSQKEKDVGLSSRLFKAIRDINNYFFAKDLKSKNEISAMMQNIIRQNSFFEQIMMFVQNSELTYKQAMNELILVIIDYLTFYTYKNQKNFKQLIENYHRFKWLFLKQSFGQHKLIYILIFHQDLSSQLKAELVTVTLQSFRNSGFFNCYGVMTLIKLAIDDGKRQESTASLIQRELIANPSLVAKICKTDENTKIKAQNQNQSYNYEQVLYYWFLVIRLFVTVSEHCNEADTIREILKQHLTMRLLLNWFTPNTPFTSPQIEIADFMLKQQIINYFLKYYENELFTSAQKQDRQILRNFFSSFGQILQNYQYYGEPKLSEMGSSEIYPLVTQAIKTRDGFKQPDSESTIHIHYTLLAVFYPFLLSLANQMLQESREQTLDLISNCTYKIQELVELISTIPKEYNKMKQKYKNAINNLEQMLKVKLTFKVDENLKQKSQEKQKQTIIFRNRRLDTLIINMQASKQDNKVINEQIYAAVLVIVFSPQIKKILQKIPKKIHALTELAQLQRFFGNIYRSFKQNKITFQQTMKHFVIFLHQHPKIIQFMLKFDPEIFKYIALCIFNFDINSVSIGKEFLSIYFFISNYLIRTLIQSNCILKTHIFSSLATTSSKQRTKIIEKGSILLQQIEQTLLEQKRLYDQLDLLGQVQRYQQTNCLLNFEQVPGIPSTQEILKYIMYKYALTQQSNKEDVVRIMTNILQLIKSYTKFLKNCAFKYFPIELFGKLQLCFKVVKVLLGCQSNQNIKVLLDNFFYNEFNVLLMLDDSLESSYQANQLTPLQSLARMEGFLENKLGTIYQIYVDSCAFYGEKITLEWSNFPLQNMPPHYTSLKTSIISVMKELKHLNTKSSNEFLLHINQEILMRNIIIVYNKYYNCVYDTTIFGNSLMNSKGIRQGFTEAASFQNGVDFTSLMMYIQQLRGDGSLQRKYIRYCEYKKKDNIQLLKKIIFVKNKDNPEGWPKILEFFYTKMGRVEILYDQKLYSVDFIVYPECIINHQTNKQLLKSINFVSTQLKIDSLKQNSLNFSTLFTVYQKYAKKYCNIRIMRYIDKYLIVLKIVSLALIVLENIIKMTVTGQVTDGDYFHSQQFFRITVGINLIVEIVYFVIYTFKVIPIILAKIKNKQSKDQQLPKINKPKHHLLVVKQLFKDRYFIYCIVVLAILLLVFLKGQVIAILIICFMIQIPQMSGIFKTLWRAVNQILLAIVAFSLFGYYFSIIVYLVFYYDPDATFGGYCENIGTCYNLVIYFYYRIIGGFVGLLYQIQRILGITATFRAQDLVADFYLIVNYLIFESVILTIIVYELSKLEKEQAARRENMQFNCLICGLSGITFNKSSTFSFKTHISSQHNLHNYLYYYYYLSKKASIDRNRWEQKIILDAELNWFPIGYAKGFVQIDNSASTS